MEDEILPCDSVNRNIGYLLVIETVTKLLSFCTFALLARALVVEQYGVIVLAFSVGSLFYIFFNLGLEYHLIRDIKQARLSLGDIFSAVLGVKVWAVPVFLVVFGISFWLMKWPRDYFFVILFIFVHFYIVSSLTVLYFFFRAFEKFKFEFAARLCHAVGLLICTILFGYIQKNLFLLSLGYLTISSVTLFVFFIFSVKFLGVSFHFNPSSVKKELAMLDKSKYLFFTNVCTSIFSGIDIWIISFVLGLQAVAVYKNAILIPISLFMFPTIVMQAFYPRLVQYSIDSPSFWDRIRKILKMTVIGGLIIVTLLFVFAPFVIVFLFGPNYVSSVILFRITLLAFLFACVNQVLGYGLMAAGEYKVYFLVTLVVSICSVALNLTLINILGLIGAALTLNITHLLLIILPLVAVGYRRRYLEVVHAI